ncbi:TAXI family TRAP transporter solute-binding subunit [Salinisphaera sp. LB1]|uniref:TAXI family TRAP transporter solute-binding subunit n=1 Tax=Salinisphaera sp. LB1 TaxID=2183911 RepID=UPI000D7080DB|nr:TAXI family TRAP transporter solute-binding subunit [Salinisphaera sp. LB1]AWN15926.1 TRAP transporter solute receptor, unknown substrate 1 [Salinisphaera sp. LB1]
MTSRNFWVASALAAVMALAGCGQSSNDQDQAASGSASDNAGQSVNLIFGTGGTSGTYYPIGGALKGVFEKSDRIGNVQVVSTGASVQNINNIMDGTNQIAIVMSDVAYDALKGNNQFKGRPAKIDALAGLYPNVVQIVALDGSNIHSVADLKGKRVGVGKVGSGVEASAKKVLESAGLKYDDLARVSHTGYADSVTDMSNGNLDAAFFTSGVPNSSITGLMQNTKVHFVNVDGATAKKLLQEYPYYENYDIPAHKKNEYDLANDVHTVSIRNLLIVPASMDKAVARDLAQRFYDYLGSDSVSVAALKQFDRNKMNQNLVLPVHPGAKAFYDTLNQGGSGSDGSSSGGASDAGKS